MASRNCLEASKVLPHFQNYTSLSTKPVINAWRGGGRWFSWQFLVDEIRGESMAPQLKPCKVRAVRAAQVWRFRLLLTEVFSAHRGGNQGGEGVKTGGQWWIENVLEDLVYVSSVCLVPLFLLTGPQLPQRSEMLPTSSSLIIKAECSTSPSTAQTRSLTAPSSGSCPSRKYFSTSPALTAVYAARQQWFMCSPRMEPTL